MSYIVYLSKLSEIIASSLYLFFSQQHFVAANAVYTKSQIIAVSYIFGISFGTSRPLVIAGLSQNTYNLSYILLGIILSFLFSPFQSITHPITIIILILFSINRGLLEPYLISKRQISLASIASIVRSFLFLLCSVLLILFSCPWFLQLYLACELSFLLILSVSILLLSPKLPSLQIKSPHINLLVHGYVFNFLSPALLLPFSTSSNKDTFVFAFTIFGFFIATNSFSLFKEHLIATNLSSFQSPFRESGMLMMWVFNYAFILFSLIAFYLSSYLGLLTPPTYQLSLSLCLAFNSFTVFSSFIVKYQLVALERLFIALRILFLALFVIFFTYSLSRHTLFILLLSLNISALLLIIQKYRHQFFLVRYAALPSLFSLGLSSLSYAASFI